MARNRIIILALTALLLSGGAKGATASANPPVTGRISLRDAVDRALKKNLGLAISRADVEKADAGIDIALSAFDPVFVLGTGFNRYQSAGADYVRRGEFANSWTNNASVTQRFASGTSVTAFSGFDPNLSTTAIVSPDISTRTGIRIRQALTRGADEVVNLAPVARARLNLERSKANLRIASADLIRDTEITYRRLAASRDLVAIREAALHAAESLLNGIRIRRRPEIATATEQDELEAAAEVAARKVDLNEANNNLAANADNLRRLIGEDPSSSIALAPPVVDGLPESIEGPGDFVRFMGETDRFNPEAELRDIDIRDSDTAVAAALDATTPSLAFVAGASTLGRGNSFTKAIEGQWRNNGSDLSAGLELTIPLGQRESEAGLRSARRSREQALYRMADTRRSAGYAARAAWRDFNFARERLALALGGLETQTRAYRGMRARLENGLASVNDVLQAATRLENARLAKLNAMLDLAIADSRRARLDGTILSRNGFQWREVDDNAAAETKSALEVENAR